MAHAGSELVVAIWALLAPAALAGLGGAIPGALIGLFVGLVLGIVLVLVLRRLGALKREQLTWHRVSRAWYAFVPLSLTLTCAGLGGTLGFQWAALSELEQTGKPLCDNAAAVTFYLVQLLMKGG